jgi:hypothetical protein
VSERYDAGIRVGEQVAKDMIAVPIGPIYAWPWSARPPISNDGQSLEGRRS